MMNNEHVKEPDSHEFRRIMIMPYNSSYIMAQMSSLRILNKNSTFSSPVKGSYPTLVMWFKDGSLDPFYR